MAERTIIPIGPYHPLQEEPEFFRLYIEGETVVDVDVTLGYNHRGIEQLCEQKTFDQIPYVVERICGICSCSHPFASVQAIEDCAGAEVPERALYIRSIIGELERLHSHLLWLGLAGHFLGYNTVFMWGWRYREEVCDILEEITGNRQNYAMFRPGGVRRDLDEADFPGIRKRLDALVPALDLFRKAVTDDPVIHARTKGVGVLTKADAIAYSAVGPTSRASGVPADIRRDHPHAAYDRVPWDVCVTPNGDVYDKVIVRVLEMYESIKIVKGCMDKIPKGPIDAKIKEIPSGEGIGHYEAPRGEVYHYCRSDGSNTPARYKVRAPSYMNIPTCKATVIGQKIADASITLAAVDPCYCCTERMASAVDAESGKVLFNGAELLRLSQEKTERIRRRWRR